MAYDEARAHAKEGKRYRLALRKARTVAIELATKLMSSALDTAEVPKEAIQAMAEVLKESREVLQPAGKRLGNRPGLKTASKEETAEALKALEG